MNLRSGSIHCLCLMTAAALIVGIAGCGDGGDFAVAPVKGKVVHGGKAVEGGSVNLRPIETASAKTGITGKPASGEVKADGTFVLSTYGKDDGAVIGKHEVTFFPVMKGATTYEEKIEPSPYTGLVPKERKVEIKAGQNDITIEIVKP